MGKLKASEITRTQVKSDNKRLLSLDLVEQDYNLSSWKVEARTPVQGYPGLQSGFESSLGYMRPCLIKQNKEDARRAQLINHLP